MTERRSRSCLAAEERPKTEYRAMAEECFQWAREATTGNARSAYLEIAKIWLAVARRAKVGSCQYAPITLTLTPLSLFPEGRSANFASEPACPAPAHHAKPPIPDDGRGHQTGFATTERKEKPKRSRFITGTGPAPGAGGSETVKAKGARMPKNLDEEARQCRRHAKACALEAGAQTAFSELHRRWQFLARSYDPATVLSCWTASNIWQSVNSEAEAG